LDDATKELLAMKANKRILQNHLMQQTGKVILLQDLHNIAATISGHHGDFKSLLAEMKKEEGT
jgi:hypothetical protein